jgi:diadenosine tetraphosphate (Ap4A) HIT family hydrolase
MAEYSIVAKEAEIALEKAFGAYLIQHLLLAFVDKQIHFHIIPRYKDNITFADLTWVDDQNSDPLNQGKVKCSRIALNKIIIKLKENMEPQV